MFGQKYNNILILDNMKDAMLYAAKEGWGGVNHALNDVFPLQVTIPKKRNYLEAVFVSLQYHKIGIFNLIVPTN
jgi:hypothetical protein